MIPINLKEKELKRIYASRKHSESKADRSLEGKKIAKHRASLNVTLGSVLNEKKGQKNKFNKRYKVQTETG